MRRIFTAIFALVLTFTVCLSTLFGCNLVVVDTEKDMKQVVATIQISKEREPDVIYKKDLVISYLNYYYMYEQSYGYSRAETFEKIVDDLVKNRVFVQSAILYFAGDAETIDWEAKKYLDDKEVMDAKYSAYKDMDELIESFEEHKHDDKVGDTMTDSVRVVPTGATNDEEVDKGAFITEMDQNNFNIADRRSAFNKAIKVLQNNELLGDGYNAGDITTTDYYNQTLKNYYESALIENFEQAISGEARAKVTYEKLNEAYKEIYDKQKAWEVNDFISAINGLSASTDPVLYSGASGQGYGFVYHILLKADDALLEQIEDWKKDNPNYETKDLQKKRMEVFKNIKVSDQRTSWINAGYDFNGTNFTGDYTLTDESYSLPYKGTVVDLTPNAEADEKEYRAEKTEMTVDAFLKMMEEYLYGAAVTDNANLGGYYYKAYNTATALDGFEDRVKELMFAFSNDDSDTALNTYKGYTISPKEDTEQWEKEFAEGGRKLLDGTLGANSYVMVATSYGYHIMFISEKFGSAYDYPTLESYLDKEYGDKDWKAEYAKLLETYNEYEDTDNYLYKLLNSVSSTAVNNALSQKQNEIVNTYVNSKDCVVLYEDRYADLLK